MPHDHVHEAAAVGFDRGASVYERARPRIPRKRSRSSLIGWGSPPAAPSSTSRPAPESSPASCSQPRARTSLRSNRSRACGANWQRRCPTSRSSTARPRRSRSTMPLFDALTVAQAFHWFDFHAALAEIGRVLKPGGGLAMVWNRRDESEPWVARMSEIVDWHNRPISKYDTTDWPAVVATHWLVHPCRVRRGRLHANARPRHVARARVLDQLRRSHGRGRTHAAGRRGRRTGARLRRAVPAATSHAHLLVPPATERAPASQALMGVRGAQPPGGNFLTPLQRALLDWGEAVRRDLPWRRTRDPWAVLVSETMLQQTQVRRVVPKYEAFLRGSRPPGVCCGTDQRRHRFVGRTRLQPPRRDACSAAAAAIVEQHDGVLPDDLDALLALPGHRCVHRSRCAGLRVRPRHRPRRHQRGSLRRAWAGGRRHRVADRRASHRRRGGATRSRVGVGSGGVRSRRRGLHQAGTGMRRVPHARRGARGQNAGSPEPDPVHAGSAGISGPQSRFSGSYRQGRGRLVAALRVGPVDRAALAAVDAGWPDDPARAERVAADVADGRPRRLRRRLRVAPARSAL